MKKRLFILKMIESATALAFIFLFFFYMYLASLLAEGEINLFVAAAAIGGVIAAGRALCPFFEGMEELIADLERAIRRKEAREREAVYELRIVKDLRPGV